MALRKVGSGRLGAGPGAGIGCVAEEPGSPSFIQSQNVQVHGATWGCMGLHGVWVLDWNAHSSALVGDQDSGHLFTSASHS